MGLISTPLTLKIHIANAFMTLSPDESLLRIPTVALLKLVTISFCTADLFFLEHLGQLIWKDPEIVPLGKAKISAAFGDIMVMPTT